MQQSRHPDSGAPIVDHDIFGEAALADPVPGYRRMLAAGPVVWLAPNGMHAICGYDALTAALKNHRIFRSGRGVSVNEDANAMLVGSTLNSDPPRHDATRAITAAPLTPKALGDVRARVEAAAEDLAERMAGQGTFDAAAELAPHLPLTIVRDLVGLTPDGRDRMLDWAAATFELMGDSRDRHGSALKRLAELRAYLDEYGARDRLAPGGWARRIFEIGDEKGLAEAECAQLMRDYIAPSLDTTISAIGYGIWLFARHPDQWERLRADPALVGLAVEEIVRLNTPIRVFSRYVEEDVDLAGVRLAGGTRALVVFGAANRDPEKFPDPDRFGHRPQPARPCRLRPRRARLHGDASRPARNHLAPARARPPRRAVRADRAGPHGHERHDPRLRQRTRACGSDVRPLSAAPAFTRARKHS